MKRTIKFKTLALAINKQIKAAFPDIPITSKDIEEGFDRPSFFVDFDSFRAEQMTRRRAERSHHIVIYYFPSDRYQNKLELMETQEGLEDAFIDGLVIDDETVLYVGETTGQVIDGVLQFEFDLDYMEIEFGDDAEDDTPYMENLYYEG